MNNILEFYVKMKDMMSGGLAKLADTSKKTFSQVQDGIDKTVKKNKELADSYDRVQTKANSSGGSILKWAKGLAVAGAAMAVLNFGGNAVGKAMEFGKTKESFKVLTGSDQKGEGLANDLNKLQQNTILGPEVFKAAQTMLGFGVAQEKVLPMMKRLGDVSMGDAQKLESLTLAFSQVQAAGRLTGQDLLQFINAGFNPLNEISKKTGMSIGDLKKKMEEGGISAAMIEGAFVDATSAGGSFNGMMDKLADTPAGKMAQLSGAWEAFQVKLGESLMPLASSLMSLATPLLDIATQYLPMIQTGVEWLIGGVQGLFEPTSAWSFYILSIQQYFQQVWWYLQYIWQRVWTVVSGVFEWVKHSQILKDAFSAILWLADLVWQSIAGVVDVLAFAWQNIVKPILDALEWVYSKAKDLLGLSGEELAVSKTVEVVSKSANGAAPAGETSLSAVQAAGQGAKPTVQAPKASGAGDVAKGIAGGGPRVINITIGKMVEKIEVHASSVADGISGIERQVEEVLLRVLNSGAAIQ